MEINRTGVGRYDATEGPIEAETFFEVSPEARKLDLRAAGGDEAAGHGGFAVQGLKAGSRLSYPHTRLPAGKRLLLTLQVASAPNSHGGSVVVRHFVRGGSSTVLGSCAVEPTSSWVDFGEVECELLIPAAQQHTSATAEGLNLEFIFNAAHDKVFVVLDRFWIMAATTQSHTTPFAPPCKRGPLINLSTFFFHPRPAPGLPIRWYNHDNGDVLGDAYFACGDHGKLLQMGDSLVTSLLVEVDPAWGAYAPCSDREPSVCGNNASDPVRVGRDIAAARTERAKIRFNLTCSSPLPPPDYDGQCAPNLATGSWFSFQQPGQCAPGIVPSVVERHCSWRVLAVRKTISTTCLEAKTKFFAKCSSQTPTALGCVFNESASALNAAMHQCPDMSTLLNITVSLDTGLSLDLWRGAAAAIRMKSDDITVGVTSWILTVLLLPNVGEGSHHCSAGNNWPAPRPTRPYTLPSLNNASHVEFMAMCDYACEIPDGANYPDHPPWTNSSWMNLGHR